MKKQFLKIALVIFLTGSVLSIRPSANAELVDSCLTELRACESYCSSLPEPDKTTCKVECRNAYKDCISR